ncbi:AAA family ATPase [Humisphaera borealis]|uniref:MoxR family ATPase n=1 Tax=Humisphaera borealis TaxID=2807512 RepID=A0A7M2X3W7_9BACT|nr:MoxR family ATPase [Humisphaera borealis]QOV91460.1 MoxR family ATPase [Humisphaera borealis]
MADTAVPGVDPQIHALCEAFRADYRAVQAEIGKAIVGHHEIVDGVLTCLFVGGHALLEGVPGLGKTALIRALASALNLKFSRIQFTPDLMPADVIGTNVIMENEHGHKGFQFMHGPIFSQIVLADEINRATPKTQSALLEAMQEKQVTAGGEVRKLEEPFFVMATQNPLEQEGTYPLPEAQLDRFFYKLSVQYSGREELREILNRTTTGHKVEIRPVLDGEKIIRHQQLVKRVVIAPHVQDYAIRCVLATHPQGVYATPMVNQFLRVGASPRAAQAITLAAKVRALLDNRFHVSFRDIKEVVVPAMRHRVILNFEGEAEGMTTDMVLEKVITDTPQTIESELVAGKA